METVQNQLNQFLDSKTKFEKTPENEWTIDDIPRLTNQFKSLIEQFTQICIDLGLKKDGTIETSPDTLKQIESLNDTIKCEKQSLVKAFANRQQRTKK